MLEVVLMNSALAVDGDRSTIRDYINGNKPFKSLYRKEWKFISSKSASQ